MLETLYIIGGIVFGALVAWLLAANRTRSKYERMLEQTRDRASTAEGKASALEGTVGELRTQSERRSQKAAEDFEKLRADLSAEKEARVKAETKAKETLDRLEEEKKLLAEAKDKLTDAFKALASDTLGNSNQAFLKLAKETFEKILSDARGDLGRRQEAIQGLVKPLADSLKQFEEHIRGVEKSRQEAYAGLTEQVKTLSSTQQQLQKETGNLVTALRTPKVVGSWGQMALERVVELSGMSEHCDFTKEVSVTTETGRIRPDLVVHYPGNREIVVDAKATVDAYRAAVAAESEDERKGLLERHAANVRNHMAGLASKNYWQQFETTPEFVVMFIPGESFFAAALDVDRSLLEDALAKRVMLATPTTLLALLLSVAHGWRQEQLAKNAQQISELGRQLYERMKTMAEHVTDIGKGLEKANSAYSNAVGSIEARVLPAARRFKDLGVTQGDSEIPMLRPIETTPRALSAPEVSDNDEHP